MGSVIHVFGMDGSSRDDSLMVSVLKKSVAVVSGRRLYDMINKQLQNHPLPQLIPVIPLADCIASMKDCLSEGDVVVLASGDPLFFGIGRRILESFPQYSIEIYPAVSSMQLAFARFGIPWDDAKFVSFHGRSSEQLGSRLLNYEKVLLLTDSVNSPNVIAEKLLRQYDREITDTVYCHVGENLGLQSEHLHSGELSEIAAKTFVEPNVMILQNSEVPNQKKILPLFGLQEKEISHSRGLLTKNEVRAAVIHALRLPRDGVLWDVGAGSGSVGLEVARLFPEVDVFSIEREEEQWKNIEDNIKKFRVLNMRLIKGDAPGSLKNLPSPDRVFIGGSGGNLQSILEYCVGQLLPGGIVVVNAVIAKTAALAPEILYTLGLDVEIKEIAVQRFNYPQVEAQRFNPIKIIVGSKSQQDW
ncbi:precorrin-6y C5,15-methyltransferase (decarboxylating), CbiE & CbiT subunit [Desulfocapsa sulfexigens DSM 10523]|uniref:tRNA (guanine(46)-N(7))-methyltransferase n=1 Tax=Desulfocapsa sulfexigens (strain DSM 10523 / SB164P1) TaxID=1167006 RepID=M1PTV4_DESSD|nr:bifunctional cobalt-precorrin-7 (C(5))-methyltransferase/cobalt-precorrin-6B (C(15))-methyltransferase [Desulfocapsa sulfexigens]AGF79781.1 precorrin-6y C5,15-methyltransferase (decarboxylating), CbiE & CbiT subunit [Desulfocapsa sulfexigens DSM 10523]